MKKILTTIVAVVAIVQISYAQWTTSGSNIYNSNSGNVGIGTTSPSTNLQVTGPAIIGAPQSYGLYNNNSNLLITSNTASTNLILETQNIMTSGMAQNSNGLYLGAQAGSNTYFTYGTPYNGNFAGGGSTALFIKGTNGNIGINTTSPSEKFTVNGAMSAIGIATSPMSNASYIDYCPSCNASRFLATGSNNTTYGTIKFANGTSDFAGYRESMTILGNGNIGIGTTSPAALLQVNGPLNGTASLTFGSANTPGNTNVPLGSSTGGYNIDFYTWRDLVPDQIGARIRAERINNYQPNSALVQSMDLAFSTSFGGDQTQLTERMRIKSNGRIGIGTNNPDASLAVNGDIHTKVVRVDLSGWPDYVFKKTYSLPSLKAVKTYIDQNHHLPDMPSEAEVAKNGLNLGETNALLTKKVEELTLYLIEKDKQLKEQQRMIKNQENRLNKLESRLTHFTSNH